MLTLRIILSAKRLLIRNISYEVFYYYYCVKILTLGKSVNVIQSQTLFLRNDKNVFLDRFLDWQTDNHNNKQKGNVV